MLPKVIAIVGPTASGKTELGIYLAKKFNGEIISADSRQIYKKMNIATDKPTGEWKAVDKARAYYVDGVAHHLMDVVDPGKEFTLADFKRRAIFHIKNILRRGKLPIIVGGTGLYIWTLIDNLEIPAIPPNKKLRQGLEKKGLPKLVKLLKKMDPAAADKIDLQNPRRVIRALEILILSGKPLGEQRQKGAPLYRALQIGIDWPREVLYQRVEERGESYVKRGLLHEIEALQKQKYGWNLPSMSSIGYRQMGNFLRGEMTLDQSLLKLKQDTKNFAKRQLTWFKRDARIKWIKGGDQKTAQNLVKKFLTSEDPETSSG